MRSLRGFLAALVLLLALPIGLLYQILFGYGGETLLHLMLAAGFVLISFSVFDFALPGWITWLGCVSASILATVFLLQGVADLIQSDSLHYLAYDVLGQRLETWLVNLFIFWCVAMLLIDSRGKTRILGFVAMSIVVGLTAYQYGSAFLGTPVDEQASILKALYLLTFIWLMFESRKKISSEDQRIQPTIQERAAH